jgi:hypothetical protein
MLTVVAAVATAATSLAQDFSVTVDGKPVVFAGAGPLRTPTGALLVPLRGIFESLGATVKFDPLTRAITAVRGETTVLLRLGEAVGHVNQTPVPLQVPAQSVDGTTLVPLRFIAEAFGAAVKWDASTRVVAISTAKPVAPAPGGGTVPVKPVEVAPPPSGVLIAVDTSARSITVRTAAGANETLVLADDAVVLTGPSGGEAVRRDIAALRRGDQVVVKARDAQLRALVLEAAYGELTGTVESIAPTPDGLRMTLVGGKSLDLLADLRTTRKDPANPTPAPSAVSEIAKGDQVVIRTSPSDGRPSEVSVLGVAPKPVGKLEIVRVLHNATGRWLRAGESLTVTVDATAGAKGTVQIAGIADSPVDLVESSAGRYTATIPVPSETVAKDRKVVVSLTIAPDAAKTAESPDLVSVDTVAPVPGTLTPVAAASIGEIRPVVSATYSDNGSGIDAREVRLRVDGVDVTAKAAIADTFFSFRPDTDLAYGAHTVEATLVDKAGNSFRREWAFNIAEPVPIRAFRALPDDRPLDFGDVVIFTVEGIPGSKSAVVKLGGKLELALREDKPGTYVGAYTVRKEDNVLDAPVSATLVLPDGRVATQALGRTLTLTAGAPPAPVVLLPQEGAVLGNRVVFTGRTAPNAQIRIVVKWQGKKGGVVNAGGVYEGYAVVADARGRWVSPDIELVLPRDVSGALFTAEVIAVGTGGTPSAPVTVRFRNK